MQKYFSPQKLDTSIHFLSSLDGPPVVAHYDMSDTSSDPEVVNVDNLLAAAVVQEHSNSVGGQDTGATWRTSGLLEELNAEAGWSPSPPPSLMVYCACVLAAVFLVVNPADKGRPTKRHLALDDCDYPGCHL